MDGYNSLAGEGQCLKRDKTEHRMGFQGGQRLTRDVGGAEVRGQLKGMENAKSSSNTE